MKLTVHYKHQIHVVPCGNGNNPIKWLKEETVRRTVKKQVNESTSDEEEIMNINFLEVLHS